MANFSLLAKIGLDSKGFQKGLDKAKTGVSKFGKSVLNASNKLAKMGLGAAAAGFALLSKNAIALGSELSDIANNTNFATREFQVFRGALIDAGGSTTSMEKAIVAMQKAIVQGSEGLTTYIRGFDRLGLNIDEIKAMKPEDQFKTLAKAIAQAENQQEALTSAVEIFGQRNAGRLIEVFKRLDAEGYGKMAKDIEKTYGIMDAETQKALDKAADTIERFKNKATIRVGELIAGEADGAALKILGLAVAKAGAQLGVGMINGIADAVIFARNAFGAFSDFFYNQMSTSAKMLGNILKMQFFDAVNAMIIQMNKIPMIDIDLIDTKKIADALGRDLEKGSATYTDHLMGTTGIEGARPLQGGQESFDLVGMTGYDPGKFYDKEIENQKAILEKSREKEKELENLGSGGGTGFEGGAGGAGGSGGGTGSEGGDSGEDEEKRKEKMKSLEKEINNMQLEALRAQAKGDEDAQASLEKRAELSKKILDIMRKYNVSMEEASSLAEQTAEEPTADDKRAKKIEGLEKQIQDMELQAIRSQADGDEKGQAAMERRVDLANKIVDIMRDHNVSQEEATRIANKMRDAEEAKAAKDAPRSELTGFDLQKAANIAGKGKGRERGIGEDRQTDIRFQKMASGEFQQFIGGKRGEVFTEEQLQTGLQNQLDKDGSESLLEKINTTLEGKFVSQ